MANINICPLSISIDWIYNCHRGEICIWLYDTDSDIQRICNNLNNNYNIIYIMFLALPYYSCSSAKSIHSCFLYTTQGDAEDVELQELQLQLTPRALELDHPPPPSFLPKIPNISLKFASNLDTTPAYRIRWILLVLHTNKDWTYPSLHQEFQVIWTDWCQSRIVISYPCHATFSYDAN